MSHVTDINTLFSDYSRVKYFDLDLSKWNIDTVTNMETMFSFEQFDEKWINYSKTNTFRHSPCPYNLYFSTKSDHLIGNKYK